MANEAALFYKCLASLLSYEWDSNYAGWVRCCLSFSLLRSAIRCLRGSRSSKGSFNNSLYRLSQYQLTSFKLSQNCHHLHNNSLFYGFLNTSFLCILCNNVSWTTLVVHSRDIEDCGGAPRRKFTLKPAKIPYITIWQYWLGNILSFQIDPKHFQKAATEFKKKNYLTEFSTNWLTD